MELRKIKSALVTGADGFIGSHLVEKLLESGVKVKALAQYNSFGTDGWLSDIRPELKKELQIVLGDVRDAAFIRQQVVGCDTVFHLAALIGIPYSYQAAQSYIDVNISGTANLLQAARESEVERFIHTSTSEVYGSAQFVPMTEEHPLNAQSPYAATKIGADQLALSFGCSFELPVTIIRPFNNYGPRQSTRAIIPTLISQFVAGKSEIKVGSLDPTRDFVFVKDTARAFYLAGQNQSANAEVINVGSNFEISVGDIITQLSTIFSREVKIESESARIRPKASEVTRLWADNSKAARILGWKPEYGGLDGFAKGLRETVEWFSQDHRKIQNLDYAV